MCSNKIWVALVFTPLEALMLCRCDLGLSLHSSSAPWTKWSSALGWVLGGSGIMIVVGCGFVWRKASKHCVVQLNFLPWPHCILSLQDEQWWLWLVICGHVDFFFSSCTQFSPHLLWWYVEHLFESILPQPAERHGQTRGSGNYASINTTK